MILYFKDNNLFSDKDELNIISISLPDWTKLRSHRPKLAKKSNINKFDS